MEDYRIKAFREASLKMGHNPQDVDAYIQSVLLPKVQKEQQDLMQEQLSTQKSAMDLQDLLKTPDQKAQEEVDKAIKVQSAYEKAGLTPEGKKPDTKVDEKKKSGENLIAELEKLYYGDPTKDEPLAFTKEGEIRGKGTAISLLNKVVAGKKGSPEERLSVFKRLLESKRAQLAKLAGDSGNLALQEQIMAGRGVPDENSSPSESVQLFSSLRSAYGLDQSPVLQKATSKYLEDNNQNKQKDDKKTNIQYAPSVKTPTKTNQKKTVGTVIDQIIASANSPIMDESSNPKEANFLGKLLFPRGADVQKRASEGEKIGLDERIGVLGESTANILPLISGIPLGATGKLGLSGAIHGLTKPGSGVGERVKSGAFEGALGAALGKLVDVSPRIFSPIKTPSKARLSIASSAGEKGVAIGNKELSELSKKMIDSKIVTEIERPTLEKLASGQSIDPTEAVKLLSKAGKKAFTKSGDPRITKAADFYSLLRDGLRSEFADKIPGVIKETTNINRAIGAQKLTKRLFGPVATGLTITGAYTLLNKLGIPTPIRGD